MKNIGNIISYILKFYKYLLDKFYFKCFQNSNYFFLITTAIIIITKIISRLIFVNISLNLLFSTIRIRHFNKEKYALNEKTM